MSRGSSKMNDNEPMVKVQQFKCSACDFVSSLESECYRHICRTHLGQALINDESGRDLTRSEIISGFNKAIKLLKVLKCENCPKIFRSGLGFKFHIDVCGKNEDDVYKHCEICGKRLKLYCIKSHIKQMHQKNEEGYSQPTTALKTTSKPKKRNSAIQARKLLQSLIPDVQQEKGDLNATDDQDVDFPVANVSDDTSSESSIDDDDDDDDNDNDNDVVAVNNVHSDQHELVFSDSSDEEPTCPTDHELDKILSPLLDYIVRQGKSGTVDPKLTKELSVDSKGQLHCYNKACCARFNFRVHLENHYRRCFNGNFGFQCSYQECRMKSAKIHFLLAHFFKCHQELIDLHSLEEFKDYYCSPATSPKIRSRNKSDFRSMVDFHLNILSLPKVFPCLKPVEDCFQLIETDFRFATGVQSFKFKCTGSMDAGDNDLKHIEPLKSLKVDENCLMFNVGQCVTCIAWCPLPLVGVDQSNNDLLECQSKYPRDQYLALATSHYEDSLKLRSTPADHVCLQIWNVGRLSHSGCTANDQASLALNIQMTDYGDVLDMCWCPFGSSYQNFNVNEWKTTADKFTAPPSLVRLGLLAATTEDGWVRIYSIAHPIQLKGSYQICNLYKVKPSLLLRNRFDKFSNCNSIHWYPHYPFDMIIASYNDGHICLWKLTSWANCSDDCSGKHGHHKSDYDNDYGSVLLPHQLYIAAFLPVFCVRWINRTMFMATTMYACKLYHIEYQEVYDEIVSRIAYQKIELHPLWTHLVLLMDLVFARQSGSISIRCLSTPIEDNRFNTIVSSEDTHYQDMSLSPWMSVLALTTENGQLCTTQVLNRSLKYMKKLPSFLLYSIKLGNLQVDTLNQQQQKQNSDSASKPKPMNNVLINKTIDLDHCLEQFSDRYYFIFDDIKKPQWTLKSGRKVSARSQELTKNDLYRYYSIIKCAWNPNLSSYSWLFSASKAGICRLNNYPLVRWPT